MANETQTQTRTQQAQGPRAAAPLVARQQQEQAEQPPDLRTFLNQRRQSIAEVCGKVLDADRVIKLALLAANKVPELRNCDLASVLMSILDLVKLGLEPDGRQAALIPYKGKCTAQVMYQGWVELLFRSNQIKDIQTHLVYEGDRFRFALGEEPRIEHEPSDDADREVKPWSHVYCVIRTVNGGVIREVMSKGTVMRIKAGSKSAGNADGPWVKWETEMARKTVFKRASKWAPKTPALRDAMEQEDEADVVDGEVVQHQIAAPAKGVGKLRQLAGGRPVDVMPEDPPPAARAVPPAKEEPAAPTFVPCVVPDCPTQGAQVPNLPGIYACKVHSTIGESVLREFAAEQRKALEATSKPRRGKPAASPAPAAQEPPPIDEDEAEEIRRAEAEEARAQREG